MLKKSLSETRNFDSHEENERKNEEIMTFLISFFAIEIFSFFCRFISFFLSSENKTFFRLFRLGNWVYVGRVLGCVMGFRVEMLLSCFLAFSIFFRDLKGKKNLCFMYSCYVISSFLITILKRYYFIFLSGSREFPEKINCISRSRMVRKEIF